MPKKLNKNLAVKISIGFLGSFLMLVLVAAIYFLTLISTEYKSFPFITNQIEKRINQNLADGTDIKIGEAEIKFSQLHKIKIKFDDIRLISDDENDLVLPKIEAEFSIFNLLFLKIIPSTIRIFDPEITIDNSSSKPKIAVNGITMEEVLLQEEIMRSLSQLFLSLKNGQVAIKHFSIFNAKINFKNKAETQLITLKESQISTSFSDGYLHLVSKNILSFDPLLPDLLISPSCDFKSSEGLKCEINFTNFLPAAITFLDPKLEPLKEITGDLDGKIIFTADSEYKLSSASFNVSSKLGTFHYPQFFSDRIGFQNFTASGKLDNALKTFSLDNLNCNFGDAKFAMSLSVSDFLDKNNQKMVMQFNINNVRTNSLEMLWPVFLNQNNVRSWVVSNIKDGVIKDGYATINFTNKDGAQNLQKINSKLTFSGLSLKYDPEFPPISQIDGIASFDEQSMKIALTNGEVLQSKIKAANVNIPNFNAKQVMLEISGNVSGAAEDSLKHINYKSEFANEIHNYFSGNATTNLDIKLPLINGLKLENAYIKVLSNIKNFSNDYIGADSNLEVSTVKEFGNSNFITNIDLTNANLHLDQLNIIKKSGISSKIKTTLSFNKTGDLYLKNFDWKQGKENMSGNLALQTQPLKILEINLKNNNFANSNFNLIYRVYGNSRFLRLKGKRLDLSTFLVNDPNSSKDDFHGFEHYKKNDIEIALEEINLANKQKFENVNIDINCNGAQCSNGFIKAKLNQKQEIDIVVLPPIDKKYSQIKGSIDNIGIVSKAFNLSGKIVNGAANIEAEVSDSGALKGGVKIDSGFTILKTEAIDKIYSNNIFIKLKDKILNSNELKFNNLKLEFSFEDNVININTLIANSYTMGITAKGTINLKTNVTFLKGLIIPGYALNKVFGIGQVPIIGKIIVGEEGGGIFALRYDYKKDGGDDKGNFSVNPASAVIPGGIRNIFDLF